MAMNYLRDNHPNRYSLLLSEGELLPTMHRVNEEANSRLDMITEQMLKNDPMTKPENTVKSFEQRKIIQLTAEEIVLYEIVFVQR
ncbi:MAG: TnpV protein [Ruminiclostridium sp.]|nr:TnpV protein [Ruminiclostridium sp.]